MPIVLHLVGPRPKVPAAVAAGTDGYHRYRLQQQLVPLAWTDGPFSSSYNYFKSSSIDLYLKDILHLDMLENTTNSPDFLFFISMTSIS